jgi:uncharacterized membrane protein YciS (DUF1049 family)
MNDPELACWPRSTEFSPATAKAVVFAAGWQFTSVLFKIFLEKFQIRLTFEKKRVMLVTDTD